MNSFNIFNEYFSKMINRQKDLSQPIYVITRYWCGRLDGITGLITNNGDNDYSEIEKKLENYAWKENQMGVTEITYRLMRIDIKDILDFKGEKIENE